MKKKSAFLRFRVLNSRPQICPKRVAHCPLQKPSYYPIFCGTDRLYVTHLYTFRDVLIYQTSIFYVHLQYHIVRSFGTVHCI